MTVWRLKIAFIWVGVNCEFRHHFSYVVDNQSTLFTKFEKVDFAY